MRSTAVMNLKHGKVYRRELPEPDKTKSLAPSGLIGVDYWGVLNRFERFLIGRSDCMAYTLLDVAD